MRTYGELFATPEFTLFLTSTAQVAGQTVSGLALATLVFTSTGSPLLSSLAMFGPSLAQVVGATTVLAAADRLPPRAVVSGIALLFGIGTAVQAIPGLPIGLTFAVLCGVGVAASLGGGVRFGLLTGAALYLGAAAVARVGLSRRPPRAAGRASIADTWRDNARLWSSKPRRAVFLALWVPNGLIVGCESLFVPYAPAGAGLLFTSAAVGMLIGDTVVGRFVPHRWRARLGAPLRLLLAAPFLVFAWQPPLPLAVVLVTVSTVGYGASLLLQEQLMALTPDELSGHALGLSSSGMLAMQGVGAALAGTVAQLTSAGTGMAVLAAASLAVTLALAPHLRPAASSTTVRSDGPAR